MEAVEQRHLLPASRERPLSESDEFKKDEESLTSKDPNFMAAFLISLFEADWDLIDVKTKNYLIFSFFILDFCF